jgi:hypothetical protein
MVRTPARLDSMFTKSDDMKFQTFFAENIQYKKPKNLLLILSSLKKLQAVSSTTKDNYWHKKSRQ